MNVKTRAEFVGTLRHVNVCLMEILAAWVPSTPEMEVKILFGRHLWLAAQAADRLGRRARELRAPLHYSRPPAPAHARALGALAAIGHTGGRLEAFYHGAVAALYDAYSGYLRETDALIDEPTVVIVHDALRDLERMRSESARLLDEFPALRTGAAEAADSVKRAIAGAGAMVALEPQAH